MRLRDMARAGVLGLNKRNGEFISVYNARKLYPVVDNKLISKQRALEHGVPVPELYGVLSSPHDISRLPALVANHPSFVVKPAHGSGGDGIIVIDNHRKNKYWTVSGRIVTWEDLAFYLSNAVNGQYSLGGQPDEVMVEYRVRFSTTFDAVSYQGVPDIRIIVFRGYPAMAMVRLPTRGSDGKANLHQGAVGAGICLVTGKTIRGVLGNSPIQEHPDTMAPVVGIEIPGWENMLNLAANCYELTGLGYVGVDLVIDAERGPLMLELNARPGLNIQIANGEGLLHRLRHIETLPDDLPAEQRVQAMRDYIAGRLSRIRPRLPARSPGSL